MAEAFVGKLPDGLKRCVVCGEPIYRKAMKCIHCEGEQGLLRRRLGISTSVLPLLIALISVSTPAVPAIKDYFTPKNSLLVASYQGVSSHGLDVLVSNEGTRAGTVGYAAMASFKKYDGNVVSEEAISSNSIPTDIDDGYVVIKKDESKLIFFDLPYGLKFAARDFKECRLMVSLVDYKGLFARKALVIPCADMIKSIKR